MFKTLVVLPTYQEAENILEVLRQVRVVLPGADILVIDDSSPDGTSGLAKAAAQDLGGIDVLVRPEKAGLGGAYRTGFREATDRGYQVLVEMDSDLSHDPSALPSLVTAIDEGADMAIGSRYVPGGEILNWPVHRRLLSRYGNRYSSFVLRLDVSDTTSGPIELTSLAGWVSTGSEPTATHSTSRWSTGSSRPVGGLSSDRSHSATGIAVSPRCRRVSSSKRWP